MTDLYTDHNVALDVALFLTQRGHHVVAVRDLSLEKAGDQTHLLIAARNNWVLVTNNRADFRLLHSAWLEWTAEWQVRRTHAGILLCEQRWSPSRATQEIDNFLSEGLPLTNLLYEYRSSQGWVFG